MYEWYAATMYAWVLHRWDMTTAALGAIHSYELGFVLSTLPFLSLIAPAAMRHEDGKPRRLSGYGIAAWAYLLGIALPYGSAAYLGLPVLFISPLAMFFFVVYRAHSETGCYRERALRIGYLALAALFIVFLVRVLMPSDHYPQL